MKTEKRYDKGKSEGKAKYFAYFTIIVFIGSVLGYALLSSNPVRQREVHRHATITIEGVNMKSLKHAEEFDIQFPLHLHRADVTPILHMEGLPTPLTEFFNSINFNTSDYKLYVNGELNNFDYIFSDGDKIELRKK